MITYMENFAGGGAGSYAIKKVFPSAECIGYTEIYKPAIKVYESHFQRHKNLGDISKLDPKSVKRHNLFVAGFPCKNLTRLSGIHRSNLKGKHSGLFFPMLDILKASKPDYFIIENVASMDDIARDEISEMLGVEPILINSALVSAQNRLRYYWCNFPTELPKDRGIVTADIMETKGTLAAWSRSTRGKLSEGGYIDERMRFDGKANTCTTGIGCASFSSKNVVIGVKPKKEAVTNHFTDKKDSLLTKIPNRLLTVNECARLQTFPDGWFDSVSDAHAYHCIGDAFTAEVIIHLLQCLKKSMK